jgi:phage shock protein E
VLETMQRPVVIGVALLCLTVLAAGCASSGSGSSGAASAGATTLLAPDAFADVVGDEQTFVINVHVPDEGSIEGTDAAIPFDRIEAQQADLPADRGTPLAVYCRSGSMSAEAVAALTGLGYTDIVDLDGGMQAWTAEGLPLLPTGS